MPTITIKLSDEEYEILKKKAEERGLSSVTEYLLAIARETPPISQRVARGEAQLIEQEQARLIASVERKIHDIINPYTAKIDELSRRIAAVIERLDELRESVEISRRGEAPASRPAPARARRRGTSAIERLREDGVVFQSELTWLSNPPAFFDKLKREGAVVFRLGGEYVAVDQRFWEEFKSRLSKERGEKAEEVASRLPAKMSRLFLKLSAEGLASYNKEARSWIIFEEPLGG
ncbi:MAG: hypothetical protein QXU97_05205 [Fervidicoccaceae archaeon]